MPLEDETNIDETNKADVVDDANKVREELKNKDETTTDKKDTKVSDAEAKMLKELMKWKEKARSLEEEKTSLTSKFADIDVDAAKEALKKIEETENKELERKGEYERLLDKQKTKFEAIVEAATKKAEDAEQNLNALKQQVNELMLENSFANSKFVAENLTLTPNKAKALYANHFEFKDGQFVAYDKPIGSPNRTPIISTSGQSASFEEAIQEIINADPDKDYLLKSGVKGGSGSKPSDKTTETKKTFDNSVDKIAAGLAKLTKTK